MNYAVEMVLRGIRDEANIYEIINYAEQAMHDAGTSQEQIKGFTDTCANASSYEDAVSLMRNLLDDLTWLNTTSTHYLTIVRYTQDSRRTPIYGTACELGSAGDEFTLNKRHITCVKCRVETESD